MTKQGSNYLLLEQEFHDPDQKLVESRGIQTRRRKGIVSVSKKWRFLMMT